MAELRRMMVVGLMSIGMLGSSVAAAQEIIHASGPPPQFEVATVKLMKPEVVVSLSAGAATGGVGAATAANVGSEKVRVETAVRMSYEEAPASDEVRLRWKAKILIEIAYGLRIGSEGRVVGGPQWIDSDADRYEMRAKIDEATFSAMKAMPAEQRNRQINLMEQALLADRFKLKVHFETRQMPVYALVLAKSGSKLAAAKPNETALLTGTGDGSSNVLTGRAVTIAQLVSSPLLRPEGRMVVDRTGLKAKYDFTLKSATGVDAEGPSLFSAMEDQLGLKLVSEKAPVEVIVVDSIERPDEN